MEIGDLVEIDDAPHIVLKIQPPNPITGQALTKLVLKNTQTLETIIRWRG